MSEKGLIHIYYGDGKGKTTAALGLALRATGCGKNVVIAQFLKSWVCGEHNTISQLPNITLLRGETVGGKFVRDMSDEEKCETKTSQDECLKNAVLSVNEGQCDLLILDEAIDAFALGMLDAEILEEIIYKKPHALELIITGHKPDSRLLEHADYATEMIKRKHPYDEGINARQGIEF